MFPLDRRPTYSRAQVAPARAPRHLAPCARTALGRLDARQGTARRFLTAFRAAPRLKAAADAVSATLGEAYDAVHVRLGDFGDLCEASSNDARRRKFCPPSASELASLLKRLDALGPPRPVVVLSDDPLAASRAIGGGRRVVAAADVANASGAASAPPRVALDVELAVGARFFVGVACSTVSQLVVKRRDALGRAFLLWP